MQSLVGLAVGVVLSIGLNASAQASISAGERATLLAFYASTNGASWTNKTGWNGAVGTECNWYGVTCNGGNTVTDIVLVGNNLTGSMPALDGLPNLQTFNADSNRLTGAIPPLGGMANLQYFSVPRNSLTGIIPSISGLTNLQNFTVSSNLLSGSIPDLSRLAKLQYFYADNNQLTGSIPTLAGLSNLEIFDVDVNQLSGAIPSLGGLTQLFIFSAQFNRLSGSIPALAGLPNLNNFAVSVNFLTGPIPALTGLNNLVGFYAPDNALTGSIPSLAGLSKLGYLDIRGNQLSGPIPALDGLTGLVHFYVSNNQLTGPIPSLAGLTSLQEFLVFSNQLSGALPPVPSPNSLTPGHSTLCPNSLLNFTSDPAWDLATGHTPWYAACNIPPVCTLNVSLPVIDFGGSVVLTASCNPAATSYSWSSNTGFSSRATSGVVSPLRSTIYSVAGINGAGIGASATASVTVGPPPTGTIPASERQVLLDLFNSTNGANWNNNAGWGGPPGTECGWYGVTCDTNGTSVNFLDFASIQMNETVVLANNLSGSLPSNFSNLAKLKSFVARGNRLTGAIPPLAGMTSLEGFDVGGNLLSGNIPSLSGLSNLGYFNLQDNQLTGSPPAFPPSSFLIPGSTFLCGNSLISTGNAILDAAWTKPAGNWLACQTASAAPLTSAGTSLFWNPNESGWGLSITQQGSTIFAAWYAYDTGGKPTWYVMSSCPLSGASCTGDIYSVKGGTPFGVPWNGAGKVITKVGTGSLTFADNDNVIFNYSLNGVSVSKSLTRQIFASGTSASTIDYSALWWNAAESGWGVALAQEYGMMFAAIFTYDAGGNALWYVASSCQLSGNGCNGPLYQVNGGSTPTTAWNGSNKAVTQVGTVSFTFSDASNGSMNVTINGVTTSKPITRQLF